MRKFDRKKFYELHEEVFKRRCYRDGETFESGYCECIGHGLNRNAERISHHLEMWEKNGSMWHLINAVCMLNSMDYLYRVRDWCNATDEEFRFVSRYIGCNHIFSHAWCNLLEYQEIPKEKELAYSTIEARKDWTLEDFIKSGI